MKKLLNIGFSIVLFGGFLVSCKSDDYGTVQSIGKVKIDSVKLVNDTMNVLGIQHIKTYSSYQSQCQGFYGYDYVYGANFDRTVTAYKYITNEPCTQANYVGVNQINFNPQKRGTYTLKFWNGGDNWITKTIVVE
ncbi:hypothetical protein H3Z85_17400 [Chryseobacterium indologenes]|uniref:hypothetical protein n=1 Tax=Chryseobacterium TaxID=59732 RepID=UPI0003E06953|nr:MULTISPECIES: hypothetical protein [Chryseobacterium]ASE60880.1 hypothetical protein CEQ15_04900 [Chryseobacterium indologenes]ATN04989.1 hypothetical protein CRN76_06040 [Chryseobacterium indologenes]AYY86259.1 hypothetical protein EGX91_17710 [Chryseobacterium indologenes]MBF6644821.1 hypothetical protein [Chryseobacterium indologenes]MBU3047593.1 hypothetical protein [Chryseobacterium indologenes]